MGLFKNLFSKSDKDIENIIKMSSTFMDLATVLLLPEEFSESQMKKMLYFELGVIDYLSQSAGLGQEGTVKAATIYLQTYRQMPVNEESVLNFGVQVSEDPERARCWSVGGNAIQAWVADGEANAPLKLAKLINEA